jgi:nitroreductase
MELLEAIRQRRTTNSPFKPDPISHAHKRLLIEAAARAPSHFNSQPWRFLMVEDRARIKDVARIAGDAMTTLMNNGEFVKRYRRYFRFEKSDAASTGSGIYFDKVPGPFKPMVKLVFSDHVGALLGKFGASQMLGRDQRRIVESAPLLLAVTLDSQEYRPGELAGLYASITLGAVIQTFWLATTELNIGMQFISVILEAPEQHAQAVKLLKIPADQELVAIFRMGYKDPDAARNTIDWTSGQRKPFESLVRYNDWDTPIPPEFASAPSLLWERAEKQPDV